MPHAPSWVYRRLWNCPFVIHRVASTPPRCSTAPLPAWYYLQMVLTLALAEMPAVMLPGAVEERIKADDQSYLVRAP